MKVLFQDDDDQKAELEYHRDDVHKPDRQPLEPQPIQKPEHEVEEKTYGVKQRHCGRRGRRQLGLNLKGNEYRGAESDHCPRKLEYLFRNFR